MPRTPLTMHMASPCAACRFATCKFPNLKKKILGPPLPNPGDAPGDCHLQLDFVTSVGTLILDLDLVFPHHV